VKERTTQALRLVAIVFNAKTRIICFHVLLSTLVILLKFWPHIAHIVFLDPW